MSMKMGWRWYGEGNDPITLGDIKQIPGVESIVWALHSKMPGETGIIEILRAYHDCGFDGVIRPDHGRQLWEEGPGNCRPGYGKYDRALGIQYMLGVWDMLDRLDEEKAAKA